MAEVEDMVRFYELGEKLATSADKSKNEKEYLGIIEAAKGGNKAKLFASQQLPRFFKFFPHLSAAGINAQLDLCEDDDLNIRVTAIRGLPFLCKDTPEHLPKIADVLGQLLIGEDQEKTVVENSLMHVLRQGPKESLAAIFKHIDSPEDKLRENVLAFIKSKIFPSKRTLLQPQEEMERHVIDLIKAVQDVTGEEFAMFMDFLKSLSLFGPKATAEHIQELVGIIEGQADLGAKFESDPDHVERVLACLQMAVPLFARGGSNSKFMGFIGRNLLPGFEKVPAERKTGLLKSFAEASPHTTAADARLLLPAVVSLVKEVIPSDKTAADAMDMTQVEALLYAFNTLAAKTSNTTNALCGYQIVTGQPSDHLGEDFSAIYTEWQGRLVVADDEAKKKLKAASAEVADATKQLRAAKGEDIEKQKKKKADASAHVKCCTAIEKLVKGLRTKVPTFLSAASAPRLSWLADAAPAVANGSAQSTVAGDRKTAALSEQAKRKSESTAGGLSLDAKRQRQQQQQKQQRQQQQTQHISKQGQQQTGRKHKQQQQQSQQNQQLLQRQQQQIQQQQVQLQQLQQRQQAAALAAMVQGQGSLGIMTPQGLVPMPMAVPMGGRGGRGSRVGRGGFGRRGRR